MYEYCCFFRGYWWLDFGSWWKFSQETNSDYSTSFISHQSIFLNSLWPKVVTWRQHPSPTSLPEPMLVYYQLDPQWQTSVKFDQNTKIFIQGNATENVFCKMVGIFFRSQDIEHSQFLYIIQYCSLYTIYWYINTELCMSENMPWSLPEWILPMKIKAIPVLTVSNSPRKCRSFENGQALYKVFPMKYAHSLCFVVFYCGLVSTNFSHIPQDSFTGTGAIIWLPQCQWRNPANQG